MKLSFEKVSIEGIKQGVLQAHAAVDQKTVLLDKLGRGRGIAQIILASGDYLGEVRSKCTYLPL